MEFELLEHWFPNRAEWIIFRTNGTYSTRIFEFTFHFYSVGSSRNRRIEQQARNRQSGRLVNPVTFKRRKRFAIPAREWNTSSASRTDPDESVSLFFARAARWLDRKRRTLLGSISDDYQSALSFLVVGETNSNGATMFIARIWRIPNTQDSFKT